MAYVNIRPMLAVFLLSSLAFSQAPATGQAAEKAPAATAKPASEEVAPTAPVITIAGFCPGKQATAADCKTEVSRAEFERLAHALNPNMPEQTKAQLANAYARILVMSKLAQDRGLADKPDTKEAMHFLEMQTLSQLLVRDVQEEAAKVSAADVKKYFDEHAGQFSQATLQRIFIPKAPPNPQEKTDEAAVKAESDKILAAAKAPGADFTKLQKQAYDDLKITATPPPTELKDVRRDNVPPGQASAFELKEGEVSSAIDEPGGIYIYKMVTKKTPTMVEVEPEIRKTVEQERMQSEMEKLTANIKPQLNNAYFAGAGERPTPPSMQLPPAGTPKVTPKPPAASKPPATAPKSSTAPKTPK